MLIQDGFEIENGVLTAFHAGTEEDIRIPDGVHTIGEGVFKGMSWILNISLPDSLKRIGAMAFKGCRKLKKITFPEGLLEVGEYAFHKCHDLEELIFPESMTVVGNCAFLYCDRLKRVVITGPQHFGKGVFSHDMSLEELTINANADDSNFSDEVFEGCINLRRIILSGMTSYLIESLIDVMDSHSEYPKLIRSIAKSVYHSMQIEDGVLTRFSINLQKITLPEGITAIGKGCFFDKKGIASITLPRSLKNIMANAFLNCTGLKEVIFQNENVTLDDKAFRGCCNLEKVCLDGREYRMEDETSNELAGRIRYQILGDFLISGRILVRYVGNEEQIRIPKEVEMIGERCFFGNERLQTVICPDGLTEIREQAFEGCVSLQNIILGERLKRIEREAFAECRKLLKCNIPATTEYIGEYAFRRCSLLKPFEDLSERTQIHPYAFYRTEQFLRPEKPEERPFAFCDTRETGMSSDNSLPLVNDIGTIAPYSRAHNEDIRKLELTGVERIGKYAFSSCPNLEEIVIDAPECVIGQNAFSACPALKKVRLHVRELGKGIFSYCRQLEEVYLSGISVLPSESFAGCGKLERFEAEELVGMEARCFDECVSLDSFDFSGIRAIGMRAFERCDSLKSVRLENVECGYHAFADCASLGSVGIGKDTVLKSGVFIGCTQMHSVILDGQKYEFSRFSDCLNSTGNPYPVTVREIIASVYSCFEIREGKELIRYSQDACEVTIPEDVETVGQDVFRDHIRLNRITIPGSVRFFGSHAFSGTAWLASQKSGQEPVIVNGVLLDWTQCEGTAVIPPSVKRVAGWSFAGNIRIRELEIPSENIVIENLAFRNCLNLKKIIDPDKNEYTLSSVADLKEKDYPELIQRIFSECINCFKLDGDGNLVESTGNITALKFPDGIVSVGDEVYKDCHLLETIDFSKDTKKIGRSAFENSKWMTRVSGAGAVRDIGTQAFSGCVSLEYIDISDELRSMGSRCFEHCCSLKEIHISENLETIPERAFFRCKSLKKVVIPGTVKSIGEEAFAFCDGLEEVCIPDKTQVAQSAFAYCDKAVMIRK